MLPPGPQLLKLLEPSEVLRVLCMLMNDWWPKAPGWPGDGSWLSGEPNGISGLETSPHPSPYRQTSREGKGLEVELITNGQGFHQLCLRDKAFIKIPKALAPKLMKMYKCWEGGMPGEDMEAQRPSPIPCPLHLFHLNVPELCSLIMNWYSSKYTVFLSSVSQSSKLSNPRRQSWKLPFLVHWSEHS